MISRPFIGSSLIGQDSILKGQTLPITSLEATSYIEYICPECPPTFRFLRTAKSASSSFAIESFSGSAPLSYWGSIRIW